MTYVSWAALYEGHSDAQYFGILIPRLMEHLIISRGTRNATVPQSAAAVFKREGVEQAARSICAAKDAFHIVFIHADTGGRAQETAMADRGMAYCEALRERCAWHPDRCVTVTPRHETEAWILCDAEAVLKSLGYHGTPEEVGIPTSAAQAERERDPKAALKSAMISIRGRRRAVEPDVLFSAIAQRQNLDKLRESASFQEFEQRLSRAMISLGCIQ
jgi:hypothetical protein